MSITRSIRVLVFGCSLTSVVPVWAQQPAGNRPPAALEVEAAAAPGPQGYSYDAAGRRDPFVSLLRRGSDAAVPTARPAGAAGLFIGEISVKGIVKDRTGFIAMVQGPDNKHTYIVRSGEKLMDGAVKAITGDAVVFSQDVTDPLSIAKQKEIRKPIRSTETGRS